MKKILKTIKIALILSFFLFIGSAFTNPQHASATTVQECYKLYGQPADTLFMSAISAINSDSRFDISEIQSKNGYILFLYGSKYYLLTLTKRYQNQTEIKILPQNSDYSQGSTVAQTVFNLIDLKIKSAPMTEIKK